MEKITIDSSEEDMLKALNIDKEAFIKKSSSITEKIFKEMITPEGTQEQREKLNKLQVIEEVNNTFTLAEVLLLAVNELENTAIKVANSLTKGNPLAELLE